MSIVFLCNSLRNIERAYSAEQIGGSPVMTLEAFKRAPVSGVEYIFSTWGMPALSEDEIAALFPDLKAVFYAAGSVQDFARPFLARGVRVFSAWAANAVPVAEFTVAQILLSNKGYFRLHDLYRDQGSEASTAFAERFGGNYGATVGLLGAGMIGRLVIKLLRNFDLSVLVFDPFLSDDAAAEMGVVKTSIEEVFASSDVISNHLADNERTKGILTYRLFSSMKAHATFINTGRGAQVDAVALLKVMDEEPGRTALLDVTDPEEPLPAGSPLLSRSNIFVSPHRAGSTNNEIKRMGRYVFDEYSRLMSGKPVLYEVTLPMLETMA